MRPEVNAGPSIGTARREICTSTYTLFIYRSKRYDLFMPSIFQFPTRLFILSAMAVAGLSANNTSFMLTGNNGVCGATCTENVRADFTSFSNGDLQVTLSNYVDTFYDRQVLTGIQFKFSGSGSSAGSVTSETPANNTLYNVNSTTGALTATSGSLTAWSTQLDLSPYITLTNLGTDATGGGSQGIIGSTTNGPTNNLDNHNPYVYGSATFMIHGVTGVTSATAITGVNFNFGTALDNYIAGSPVVTATPEPGSTLLLLTGLVLAGVGIRQRRKA